MANFNKYHFTSYFKSSFNWRLAAAFVLGWIISALLIDFPFFNSHIINSNLSEHLGLILANATNFLISSAGYSTTLQENAIWFAQNNGVYFAFGCLGFREIIWFSVFMLIVPGKWKHKTWYIPLGIIIIEISNILRSSVIAITNYHNPNSSEIIHVQGTVWFIYGTVLALWLFWLQAVEKNDKLS